MYIHITPFCALEKETCQGTRHVALAKPDVGPKRRTGYNDLMPLNANVSETNQRLTTTLDGRSRVGCDYNEGFLRQVIDGQLRVFQSTVFQKGLWRHITFESINL